MINWQNFAQGGLQLKFAFKIRPLEFESDANLYVKKTIKAKLVTSSLTYLDITPSRKSWRL